MKQRRKKCCSAVICTHHANRVPELNAWNLARKWLFRLFQFNKYEPTTFVFVQFEEYVNNGRSYLPETKEIHIFKYFVIY